MLLLIAVLLGIGLQLFLTKGLTTALNQGVFPAVKAAYGLDMSIANASVNLFRGSADLDGFIVRNLSGYEEPALLTIDTCRFDLEMVSLFKRAPIVIRHAELTGAKLVVERNKEKKYNVKELYDALKPAESKEPSKTPEEPDQTPKPPKKPMKPIPIHIRRFAAETTVQYIDSGRDKTCALSLRLTGSDIFTVPAEGQNDSLLVLRGSLSNDKNSFVTDLNAMIEPLTDPKNASFRATGSILDIEAVFLDDLLRKNRMESRSFSVKPAITSAKGNLKGSKIDIVLNDLKIYGEPIGDTTLKLPVNGTLQHPAMDLTGALNSLFSEQAVKIGKAAGMKELRKQLGSETNATAGDIAGEALSKQLDKNLKEGEGSEAVKKSLKELGNSLFGK
ncbi:MAG: hypothetical protein MUC65_07105 [Pontiellaceae bacterium]|nr:hypothetical protein [Pontiellaceae bacterium]